MTESQGTQLLLDTARLIDLGEQMKFLMAAVAISVAWLCGATSWRLVLMAKNTKTIWCLAAAAGLLLGSQGRASAAEVTAVTQVLSVQASSGFFGPIIDIRFQGTVDGVTGHYGLNVSWPGDPSPSESGPDEWSTTLARYSDPVEPVGATMVHDWWGPTEDDAGCGEALRTLLGFNWVDFEIERLNSVLPGGMCIAIWCENGDLTSILSHLDTCGIDCNEPLWAYDECGGPGGDEDTDEDGIPDEEDPCPDDPENDCPERCYDCDEDGDGIVDNEDPCPDDPLNECDEADEDTDGDGIDDLEDNDDDGDGCNDLVDPAPTDPEVGCDADDTDGDQCSDEYDPQPNNPDYGCLECEQNPEIDCDRDRDGCPDERDPEPMNPAVGCYDEGGGGESPGELPECECVFSYYEAVGQLTTALSGMSVDLSPLMNLSSPESILIPLPSLGNYWQGMVMTIPLNWSGVEGPAAAAVEFVRVALRSIILAWLTVCVVREVLRTFVDY